MLDQISKVLAASVLLTLGLAGSGCGSGEGGSAVVVVSGTVYLDGQLLPDADVSFISKEFTSTGRTNSEGHYELVLGAVPGENKITISKWKGGKYEINPDEGMDEGQFLAMQDPAMLGVAKKSFQPGPEQLIPRRFSDPAKSEIVFNVPESGTPSADFRISSN